MVSRIINSILEFVCLPLFERQSRLFPRLLTGRSGPVITGIFVFFFVTKKVQQRIHFWKLWTILSIRHPSTCTALWLLEDDNQWNFVLEETTWLSPNKMREIFTVILIFCHGTHLRITGLQKNLIEIQIMTESVKGESVFIPRIPMIPSDYQFKFKRMQFSINLCFI